MIIEWLNPEGTMLFGDRGNLDVLKATFQEATFIMTPLYSIPHFTQHTVDLVCVGSMTERMQEQMILWLTPYKEALTQRIQHDQGMLWFGNSCEILGHKIIRSNQETLGLNLYSFLVNQESIKRYNALVGIETKYGLILGHKSTFSLLTQTEETPSFGKVVQGFGHHLTDPMEGIHDHHLIACSLLGPLLALNPHFTQQYLSEVLKKEVKLAFEEDLTLAYNAKRSDFETIKHYIYDK